MNWISYKLCYQDGDGDGGYMDAPANPIIVPTPSGGGGQPASNIYTDVSGKTYDVSDPAHPVEVRYEDGQYVPVSGGGRVAGVSGVSGTVPSVIAGAGGVSTAETEQPIYEGIAKGVPKPTDVTGRRMTAQEYHDLLFQQGRSLSEALAITRQQGYQVYGVDTVKTGAGVLGSPAGVPTPDNIEGLVQVRGGMIETTPEERRDYYAVTGQLLEAKRFVPDPKGEVYLFKPTTKVMQRVGKEKVEVEVDTIQLLDEEAQFIGGLSEKVKEIREKKQREIERERRTQQDRTETYRLTAELTEMNKEMRGLGYTEEQIKARTALLSAGFVEGAIPKRSMSYAGAPLPKQFTVSNMAEFVRRNPDTGLQTLATYGFDAKVVDTVKKHNEEVYQAIKDVDQALGASDRYGGEEMALRRVMTDAGFKAVPDAHIQLSGMTGGLLVDDATGKIVPNKEAVVRMWNSLSKEQKERVATEWSKDYFKSSYFAEISKEMGDVAAEAGLMGTIAYAPILPIITPIAKQVTLADAKKQLNKDYVTELSVLKNYVGSDGSFDVDKVKRDAESTPQFRASVLKDTGYPDVESLAQSLEYYNYGTRVTPKEWATGGLVAVLDAMTFGTGFLSPLGLIGSAVKHGVPPALAVVTLPDTMSTITSAKTSIGEKVLAGASTAALGAGAVLGTGKFAFREIRQFVKPGTFEPSGVALEVSIPRTQLRANMTPSMAKTPLQDLERVYGSKLPEWMEGAVKQFKTPEAFQAWASEFIRYDALTGQVRKIYTESGKGGGGIKGRSNPLQAALKQNTLFSVKPDVETYVARIGREGKDVTPAGSMEWWSPNFSGDVAGWYLGKVDKFSPGGKMLRFSPRDIRGWSEDVFKSVAKKMSNAKAWDKAKADAKGDSVTAINNLYQQEVYRRAVLPIGHPDALPQGIYPVFKFHWSREPSGQIRPTWELEMITPAGFESLVFKPVKYLDKITISELSSAKTEVANAKAALKIAKRTNNPEVAVLENRLATAVSTLDKLVASGAAPSKIDSVASLTVRSPIQGKDMVSGQSIRVGQSMPVVITATKNAIAEGRGLPTLRDVYSAKYIYRPITAIQNVFDSGRAVRPRATEGSLVTTPRKWYSRAIKYEPPKENEADATARVFLSRLTPKERLSTPELAAKLEAVDQPLSQKGGLRPTMDRNDRLIRTREPFYHPVREFADNWVVPRTGVMLEHPTIKGAYVVVTDTSSAAQPGVWDIPGGQIDVRGTPRTNRPFGRISVEEAAREQIMSELGVDLAEIRPAEIHMGKTTEHSAFGTYMFDAKPTSLKFNVPMNKWFDMVKGEWVIEPEVGAITTLKSGGKAAVTPALYIELTKRGFDTRNLVVVDKGLPTAGIRQYPKGSPERAILDKAKTAKSVKKLPTTKDTDMLFKSKGEVRRIKEFNKALSESDAGDFLVPTTAENRIVTGLVPTIRSEAGVSPTMTVRRISAAEESISRPEEATTERIVPESERGVSIEEPERVIETVSRVEPVSEPSTRRETPEAREGTRAITETTVRAITREEARITPEQRPEPRPEMRTEPRTDIRPEPRPEIVKPEEPPPPPPPPPILFELGGGAGKGEPVISGSIAWRQGMFWKYIPPPWNQAKPVTLPKGVVPIGAIKTGRTPADTIQMIGKPKSKVPKTVSVDLGVVDILIEDYGQRISFTGKGEQTDVGENIAGTTQGMSVPAVDAITNKKPSGGRKMPTREQFLNPNEGEMSAIETPSEELVPVEEPKSKSPIGAALGAIANFSDGEKEPVGDEEPKGDIPELGLTKQDEDDIFGTGSLDGGEEGAEVDSYAGVTGLSAQDEDDIFGTGEPKKHTAKKRYRLVRRVVSPDISMGGMR